MKEPAGQLWRINIWPGRARTRGSLYVRVRVFESRPARRAHRIWAHGSRDASARDRRVAGFFRPLTVTKFRLGRARTSPLVGEVCLNVNDMGAGIVAHEMLHATMAWLRRKRIRDLGSMEREEQACYALGWLVVEFWRAYFAIAAKKSAGRVRLSRCSR